MTQQDPQKDTPKTDTADTYFKAAGSRYTVVVAYDFSDTAELALDEALRGASGYGSANLHVVAVLDNRAGRHPKFDDAESVRNEINAVLSAKLGGPAPEGIDVRVHVRIGVPYEQILDVAEESSADLVVIGTHGRTGVRRVLLGSVSERVVRLANCPVYVVRPKTYENTAEENAQFAPEPACPECVELRAASNGASWWCDRCDHKHHEVHVYSYTRNQPNRSESILW